ncbi:hypothetical protein LUZ61_001096 [Rhynchospora tenuis]|uniref:Serpin domain-containing protein n=1 Tax=Rhynchospora tenuis TaxID=198213 RepID=A0AAD6EQJ3_9POAL|nr:hypothetical protein LUZ61_001096 [Rhynchospora tenuis]
MEQSLTKLVADQTAFLLRLSSHVNSQIGHHHNFVFSPLSFHVALSLLATGASGRILYQLLSILCPGSDPASSRTILADVFSKVTFLALADVSKLCGSRLACANGVWLDESFRLKKLFKKTVSAVYKADINSVDFKKKVIIVNYYALVIIYGKVGIWQLRQPVRSTRTWAEKFDPSRTIKDDFHLLDGTSVKVPFMSSNNYQYISKYTDFSVLGLP